jgi:hypothetical protein
MSDMCAGCNQKLWPDIDLGHYCPTCTEHHKPIRANKTVVMYDTNRTYLEGWYSLQELEGVIDTVRIINSLAVKQTSG